MPVNYLSKPVEVNPYVLPVDLNLLAKVNSYKQSQFYQNAQKVQDSLGTIANADILNPTQKEYLNNAVNSVTKKINDYGAIDYSDLGVANSIETLGNEISRDNTVLNGIASTKKVRQIQANYQKMANDPKLSKYYNPAYEKFDEEFYIKPYINSDNLQASYDGPTNPTIYTGNPLEKAIKLIKQAKPTVTEHVVNGRSTGGYIDVETKTVYTPQQLVSSFRSTIDGQTKTELMKNAWYTLDYTNRKEDGTPVYGEDDYAKMLSDQSQNTLDNLEATLKATNEAILNSGLDVNSRKQLQENIRVTTQEIENLKASRAQNDAAFRNVFKKDKLSALYQLYLGDLEQSMHNIMGAEQTKLALKPDLVKAQEWREKLAWIKEGFDMDGYNADGTPRLKPVAPGKTPVDVKTDFTIVDINTETSKEAKANELSINKINEINNGVYNELNSIAFNYVKDAAINDTALWEAFAFQRQVTGDANSAPTTYSSTILNKIAQSDANTVLTIEDFERALKYQDKPESFGLNQKAISFIKATVDSYDKLVRNVDNDQPIDAKTRDFISVYQDKSSIINSNKKLVNDIRAKVVERKGLNQPTPYQQLMGGGLLPAGKPKSQGGTVPDDIYYQQKRELENKAKVKQTAVNADIDAEVNKELALVSNRKNYFSIVLREDNDKLKVKELVPGLENLIKLDNESTLNGSTYKLESIQPISLTKSPEGWKVGYTVEDKKGGIHYSGSKEFKDLLLTNEQALKLGAQVMPYEGLEQEAYVNGESVKDYYVPSFFNVKTNGTVAKYPKPVRVKVQRTTDDRNNPNYVAKIFIPTLNDWKVIPFKQGDERYSKTANSAYYYATSLLDDYSKKNVGNWGVPAADEDGNVVIIKNPETFYKDIIEENQNK